MSFRESLTDRSMEHSLRDAGDAETVGGVRSRYVAQPSDEGQVSSLMALAAKEQFAVVPVGNRTKLDWGSPPSRLELLVDVSQLNTILEHNAGDLVVRVQPGVTLATLQAALAPARQRLAIDDVVAGSTIGGVVSTALTGPLRLLYGGVRDLLIGITVVRADGVAARSGGRVVKNVAGYDLCKLYAGAYGTLGVITEAIFRLHPVPESSVYVRVDVPDSASFASSTLAILASQLQPSGFELNWQPGGAPAELWVLLEGSIPGVSARVERLSSLLRSEITTSTRRPEWWGVLPGDTTAKVSSPIGLVAGLLADLDALASRLGVPITVRGSVGVGTLYVGLAGEVETSAAVELLHALRAAWQQAGGFAVILRAGHSIREKIDVWGRVPALQLMQRVKDSFDPEHRLAPGRFVGGI